MKKMLVPAALALAALSGCSENNSQHSDGRCKDSFINAYNDVNSQVYPESILRACDKFFAEHPGRTCEASRWGINTTVKSDDHKLKCDSAKSTVEWRSKPVTPSATPIPVALPDTRCSTTFSDLYKEIDNASTWSVSSLNSSCTRLYTLYPSHSCDETSYGVTRRIYSSTHRSKCDAAKLKLERRSKPATPPAAAPSATPLPGSGIDANGNCGTDFYRDYLNTTAYLSMIERSTNDEIKRNGYIPYAKKHCATMKSNHRILCYFQANGVRKLYSWSAELETRCDKVAEKEREL